MIHDSQDSLICVGNEWLIKTLEGEVIGAMSPNVQQGWIIVLVWCEGHCVTLCRWS